MADSMSESCDAIRDRLAGYVVGVLSIEDHRRVEQHLIGCSACRLRVSQLRAAANALPDALAVASPFRLPANLKQSVMAAAQSGGVEGQAAIRHDAPRGAVVGRIEATRAGLRREAHHPWRTRYLTALGATLLVILSLGWGVWQSVALAREQVLRQEFANLVSQQQVVIDVIDSPKTTKAQLRTAQPGSSAYGRLYTRLDMVAVVVMAARLAPPPPGLVYQLWLTDRNGTHLAGALVTDHNGFGLLVFQADRPGPEYLSAQVVLQPVGSTAPTGDLTLIWHTPN
jgi:anti-sigma factor RsiW